MLTSFNMDDNPLASYLYLTAGVVSVVYALSVHYARRKQRKARPPEDLRPTPVDDAPAADGDTSPPEVENRELAQHGGSIASSAQPEAKP